MMRLLLILLPSIALADIRLFNEGADAGIITTINCIGNDVDCVRSGSIGNFTIGSIVMAADLHLFVSTTGNDSNACTGTGTAACLTVQGAINKVPKRLTYRATITIGAGSFGNFSVSGFSTDIGIQRTTSGILIDGTLANSTGLATGTASGTATAGSAGSTNVFGTITDGTQSWTTNNLQGRFLTVTGGTGALQVKTICSNSPTVITVCGNWTAPTAGSTYAIQDSTTLINTCGLMPPNASGTQGALTTSIRVQSNAPGSTITLRGMSLSGACSFGVYSADASSLVLNRLQFPSASATAAKITHGGPILVDTIASSFAGTSGIHVSSTALASINATVLGNVGNVSGPPAQNGTIQNSLFVNGATGINRLNGSSITILEDQFVNISSKGIQITGPVTNFQGLVIDCTAAAGASAVYVGDLGVNSSGAIAPDHVTITDCEIGFTVSGPSAWIKSVNALTTSTVTTGYSVINGGLVSILNASGIPTVSGSEISLDNGATTGAFSSIPSSGNCFTSLNYGSRVCRD